MSRVDRLALIEREGRELPLATQAQLLSLNRSGLYYQPVAASAAELALKRRIDEIYTARPFYGVRRITAQLRREGRAVNHKTVARQMRALGLAGITLARNLSRPAPGHRIYPYLLRTVTASYPDHVWGIDITYIRLRHGWLYLVAVLDWFSRYVVSWELDQTMEEAFVLVAVRRALTGARPVIWNSDQGSQFTSPQYTGLLLEQGVQISMDGRGRAFDNIFTERLWRSVKYEEVYLHDYATPREARTGLSQYFQFYNGERLHQALDYRTPTEVYFGGGEKGGLTLNQPLSVS